jgi:hypothetical protein
MSSSHTSKKLRIGTANQFLASFQPASVDGVNYVYIARHLPWANDASPTISTDTVYTEKDIWNNLIAAKKITSNDVEIVIPRQEWQANVYYRQYDDTITLDNLLTANVSQNLYPMYVMNSEKNVYKCLSNGSSTRTSEEPIGENLGNAGVVVTSDGYIWKYLYNVDNGNIFLTNTWIPAPTSTSDLEYNGSVLTTIDGEITTVVVTNPGLGYRNSNVQVSAFNTSCSFLTVSGTVDIPNTIFTNMAVSGNGIINGTYITAIDPISRRMNLSSVTSSSGGGSANLISISTRVSILGDGSSAFGTATIVNTSIQKITLSNYGRDYNWSNIIIYGTSTGANVCNARAIIAPKFGHGFDSAKELGGHNVMIAVKIGEVDTTEGGIISANTSFRQYGLLKNPYKYGQSTEISYSNANTAISQTHDVTLIAGSLYDGNEFVYQGNINNPTFSGYVDTQTSNIINLTNVRGTITVGTVLKGTTTNPTGRTVFSINYPELEPYTGDILYNENIEVVQREVGQAENIKFVVKF